MSIFRNITRRIILSNIRKENSVSRNVSTYERSGSKDPAPVFIQDEVQTLLKSLSRTDLKKVFKRRKLGENRLSLPVYKFMTDEQLQEAYREAEITAAEILQIPPVVQVREPVNEILEHQPALQGLDMARIVFTDITFGKSDKERLVVVREPDGTLKKAEWELRDRMNQVYFPVKGRMLRKPKMFEESYLQQVIKDKKYEFILDRACVQFEPDDPEYQKIVSMTYEHIDQNQDYELLRSTRHFGSLVFYLAWFKKVDNLLLELIETYNIEEANLLVKLYGNVHKIEYKTKEILDEYIKEHSVKKGPLELAIQAYRNVEQQRKELETGIKTAHGNV